MAIGTSIMNQCRVERHLGVEDKILYQRPLINQSATVNRKLRTALASFQLAAASFCEHEYHQCTKGHRDAEQSSWLPKERAFFKTEERIVSY